MAREKFLLRASREVEEKKEPRLGETETGFLVRAVKVTEAGGKCLGPRDNIERGERGSSS